MKIELLLPVGNQENLAAAVENGADAVYFGIDKFNARRRADNFKLEKIKEVIDYCHQNGVRCYCTLNILIKNEEIEEFFATITQLYLSGIDAVIIQHLSFLPIIKKNFPGLEVHLSTQTTITNTYFHDLIKQADKVVLPRELSKEEIENFINKTKLPTEIFVQGALCFSYSGKCLFSSFLGGRSGNRGLCAQPCRKRYNGKYLLSMKDLCLVKEIPNLIKIGVSSLKIEGRLRSAKYVAAATKLYRTAIDSYYVKKFAVDKDLFKEMKMAFNREFTWGYYANLKNVVSDEKPMGRGLYLGEFDQKKFIKLEEEISLGDGLGIWLPNKVDGAVLKKMELVEEDGKMSEVDSAQKGDYVKLHIYAKPGTKIYKTSSVEESKAIEFVKNKPIVVKDRKVTNIILPEVKEAKETGNEELLVKVYSVNDGKEVLRSANKVFYDIFADDFNNKFSAYVPRMLNDIDVEQAIKLIEKHNVKNVLVGDLGVYAQLKKKKLNLYLDYSNNIFNNLDLEFFDHCTPIISPELSFAELKEFSNKNFAVLAHGKVVMMNTKYSLLPTKLRDEKKYSFPVREEHNYYQILNSKELGLFELVGDLKKIGIKRFFLDLDNDVDYMAKFYHNFLKGKVLPINIRGYTKGHWDKGVE
ncbi:U32 family peptidase [Candidatus Woesearchaeota archaeon]|nr:U32 family peptidase [Candidatus Woesearchaeota archaeon]